MFEKDGYIPDDEKEMKKKNSKKSDAKRFAELEAKFEEQCTLSDEEHEEYMSLRSKAWDKIERWDKALAIGVIAAIVIIPIVVISILVCIPRTVTHLAWERHIYVEEYGAYTTSGTSLPDNANLIKSYSIYDGGRSSHIEYTYSIVGWHIVDDRVTQGVDNEPYFAELEMDLPTNVDSPKAGDLRVSEGVCYYWITFDGSDELKVAPSYEVWSSLKPGDKFSYLPYVGEYLG